MNHFNDAVDRDITPTARLFLDMAECEFESGRINSAANLILRAEQYPAERDHTAEIQLLKCQLALAGEKRFEKVLDLLPGIDADALSEADRHFLAGLQSASSPPALEHFRNALQLTVFITPPDARRRLWS